MVWGAEFNAPHNLRKEKMMFLRYLYGNIKSALYKYILLVFCIITVIVMTIAANAMFIDSAASQNNTAYRTRVYQFFFDRSPDTKNQNAVEAREKLFELIKRTGLEYHSMTIYPTAPNDWREGEDPKTGVDYKMQQYKAENYGETSFWWFPTYREMVDTFTDAWNCGTDIFPTEDQYYNDKVIILGSDPFTYRTPENEKSVKGEYKFSDEDHVIIIGEEFLVTGMYNGELTFAFFPAIPQDTVVGSILIEFKKPLTVTQINSVDALINELFGNVKVDIYEPKTQDLLDMRKSTANIILTAMVQIICVFNILIIYKFMADSRKKQFAVMRLCGFKKFRCLLYLWGELALITVVCLPIAFGIFELIKPELSKKYGTVPLIFTPGYYLVLGFLFFAVMTVVFIVYIIPSFGKTVSRELREM